MSRVMHQDRQAQLPRANQHDGKHVGRRIGPSDKYRPRAEDKRPGAGHAGEPAPG